LNHFVAQRDRLRRRVHPQLVATPIHEIHACTVRAWQLMPKRHQKKQKERDQRLVDE
jgi:hypothetical protein